MPGAPFIVSSPDGGLDFSGATREDLMQDLSLLSEERSNEASAYDYTLYLRGGLTAVLQGERNLDRIDEAEDQVEDEGLKQLLHRSTQDIPPSQPPTSH